MERCLCLMLALVVSVGCDSSDDGDGGDKDGGAREDVGLADGGGLEDAAPLDEDDWTGVYEITEHTLLADCEDPWPVGDPGNCSGCVATRPFFKIKRQRVAGQALHVWVNCARADLCDEVSEPDLIDLDPPTFDEASSEALRGSIRVASGTATSCDFTLIEHALTPIDGGVELRRAERRLKANAPSASLSGEACLDLTDGPPPEDELECLEQEIVKGRAL